MLSAKTLTSINLLNDEIPLGFLKMVRDIKTCAMPYCVGHDHLSTIKLKLFLHKTPGNLGFI